jgi:hypothetical protein
VAKDEFPVCYRQNPITNLPTLKPVVFNQLGRLISASQKAAKIGYILHLRKLDGAIQPSGNDISTLLQVAPGKR